MARFRIWMMAACCSLLFSASPRAETVTFKVDTKSDPPVRLSAQLDKPDGAGPFAAIVMLHGCGGIWKRWGAPWSRHLVAQGYVTLRVDSFGPRGFPKGVCNNPGAVGQRIRAIDAHTAKDYLADLAFVDGGRIALMGMSHGGAGALWAIQNVDDNRPVRANPFKATVAIYPYCWSQVNRLDAPLLLLIGDADDWTFAHKCSQMNILGPRPHEMILKIYPGATHAFDVPDFDYEYMGHKMKYHPAAHKDAVKRVRDFLAKYLK